ncbi:MAG: DUF5658 family protein [Syntrophomonadaceae bacterium]|nr:DUF5658 family protein [Syntrophomonadaceae bacterium]
MFVSNRRFYVLLLLIFILNYFDIISTIRLYHLFGTDIEANPIMKYLLVVGPEWALLFKTFCILVFTIVMIIAFRYQPGTAYKGTLITAGIFILLAGWHFFIYLVI